MRYVAKFGGNPQGNRTLVNEIIVSGIMNALGISTPKLRILALPPALLRSTELYFLTGTKRVPVTGRLQLGSQYPVNPDKRPIFDFLPQRLLPRIVNLTDFASTWVLDQWLYNIDRRQAIFVKATSSRPIQFQALMIDNGQCLGGSSWEIREANPHADGSNRNVHQLLDMEDECSQALAKIESLSPSAIYEATGKIPADWLPATDREHLARLIDLVFVHRTRLPAKIERQLRLYPRAEA
jgi:hypothetical protein